MTIRLSSDLASQILAHAAESPGEEVCGLLFGTVEEIVAIQPTRNIATDIATEFEIDTAALIAAHKAARSGGPPLIGFYHSHPNGVGVPSARDAAAAMAIMPVWIIVADRCVNIWLWTAAGFKANS